MQDVVVEQELSAIQSNGVTRLDWWRYHWKTKKEMEEAGRAAAAGTPMTQAYTNTATIAAAALVREENNIR